MPHARVDFAHRRSPGPQFPHYRGRDVLPYSAIRDGRWKLIQRHEGPAFELYDLVADPGETTDVATEQPRVVHELRQRRAAHLSAVGAQLPRPNDDHVAKPRVLILGDSISIGYTPHLRTLLEAEAVVVRPTDSRGRPENCAGTAHALRHLDRWLALGGGRFDVIHFNFGLHDMKRLDPATGRNANSLDAPRQAEPWQTRSWPAQARESVVIVRVPGPRSTVPRLGHTWFDTAGRPEPRRPAARVAGGGFEQDR